MDTGTLRVTLISAAITAGVGFPGAWMIARHQEMGAADRQRAEISIDRQRFENEVVARASVLRAQIDGLDSRVTRMDSRLLLFIQETNKSLFVCCGQNRTPGAAVPGRYSNASCEL